MFTPKGIQGYRNHWTSGHPNGKARIIDEEFPRKPFMKDSLLYNYTRDTNMKILKEHNNLAIPETKIKNSKIIGKTTPGILSDHMEHKENFVNLNNKNSRVILLLFAIIFIFFLLWLNYSLSTKKS